MNLDRIAEKYRHAKVGKCAEAGCSIRTTSGPEFLILKGEIVDPSSKMCDCLVFRRDGKIVLVELKNTVQHARKIAEKFEKSIAASFDIASETDSKVNRVILVLLANRYRRAMERGRIRSTRLRRGKDMYVIQAGRCGDLMSKFTG